MNVLYYTHYAAGSFEKGGGALAIWYAADALADIAGVNLTIAFVGDVKDDVLQHFSGRSELIGMNSPDELPEVLETCRPDIFHGMLPSSERAIRYCRRVNIPVVYEVRSATCYPCKFAHKLRPPYLRQWRQMLKGRDDRRVAGMVALVLVPSSSARQKLNKFYNIPDTHSLALYNGVNRELFYTGNKRDDKSDRAIRIVNAGRVEIDRHFDTVIRVYQELQKLFPDKHIELLLAGDGSQRANIECLASKVDGVRVLGSIAPKELADLYRSSDLLLNASESESFGNVVAEAMSCGLPVVCFSAGSLRELVVHKETGYLCEMHNEQELLKYTAKLVADSDLRIKMGKSSCQRSIDEFSWQKRAEQVYGAYQRLLSEL